MSLWRKDVFSDQVPSVGMDHAPPQAGTIHPIARKGNFCSKFRLSAAEGSSRSAGMSLPYGASGSIPYRFNAWDNLQTGRPMTVKKSPRIPSASMAPRPWIP